jgi:hypothetical protein
MKYKMLQNRYTMMGKKKLMSPLTIHLQDLIILGLEEHLRIEKGKL